MLRVGSMLEIRRQNRGRGRDGNSSTVRESCKYEGAGNF